MENKAMCSKIAWVKASEKGFWEQWGNQFGQIAFSKEDFVSSFLYWMLGDLGCKYTFAIF